jgi:hypothetical protein
MLTCVLYGEVEEVVDLGCLGLAHGLADPPVPRGQEVAVEVRVGHHGLHNEQRKRGDTSRRIRRRGEETRGGEEGREVGGGRYLREVALVSLFQHLGAVVRQQGQQAAYRAQHDPWSS